MTTSTIFHIRLYCFSSLLKPIVHNNLSSTNLDEQK